MYRTKWHVSAKPTLVRYQRVDGDVKEVGRLVEAELMDHKKIEELIRGQQLIEA